MRIYELITEKAVDSAWITDMTYNRKNRIATLTVSTGRQYQIFDIARSVFDNFHRAPSKGAFYNYYIKHNYEVVRIR